MIRALLTNVSGDKSAALVALKDALSASYGHSVDRLFAEARERQKHSGHQVVNLQRKRPTV